VGSTSSADDELTPHLGLRFGGEFEAETIDVDALEVGPVFGLTYDHRLSDTGWLWTAWSLQPTEFDAPGLLAGSDTIELDVHYLHVGSSYRSKSDDRAQGFVVFGLGLTWVDPEPSEFESGLGGSILAGGGFRTPIRPGITFRFDLRGYATFTDTELKGICGGVGCVIEFTGSGTLQLDMLAGLSFQF
jgi:hypothetical protein